MKVRKTAIEEHYSVEEPLDELIPQGTRYVKVRYDLDGTVKYIDFMSADVDIASTIVLPSMETLEKREEIAGLLKRLSSENT